MSTKSTHSLSITANCYKAKDNYKTAHGVQKWVVYEAFKGSAKTMLEVEKITGVVRTTICGYVGQFRKKGLITDLYKAECEISKNKAIHFKIVWHGTW